MRYSEIAFKILVAKECGLIKSNAQFWRDFSDKTQFEKEISKDSRALVCSEKLTNECDLLNDKFGMICVFDDEFPIINPEVKNNGDKPYLLFYKGNLSLLKDLNKNIAVIGLTDPNQEIIKREKEVIKSLVNHDMVILSGLAIGCDTVAHKTCLDAKGKTIAILPSQLNKIYPAKNRQFAEEIVNNDGLLISEYYKEANSRYESINRLVKRDRLQAMFTKGVILIASYRKGEGDSGSRHAMEAARKYKIERYVMYNHKIDHNNKQFGLNKDLINNNRIGDAKILQSSSIAHIKSFKNPKLDSNTDTINGDQLSIL